MTKSPSGQHVAFIGAGQMGMPMVRRLVGDGRAVTVFARRAEVRTESTAIGAGATATLGEAVSDADIVVVCVYSDAQLLELALGPDGFLAAAKDGATVLVHTTGSPATAAILAEHGAGKGVRIVEAPVSGSAEDIAAGCITVLLGGDTADVAIAREVVAAYGDPILHVGPLGAAQAVKLLNNALLAAHLQLLADVERIAADFGVDWPQAAAAIQQSSGASRALSAVQRQGSVHNVMDAGGHFLRKDVAIVTDVADQLGIDLGQLREIHEGGALAFLT